MSANGFRDYLSRLQNVAAVHEGVAEYLDKERFPIFSLDLGATEAMAFLVAPETSVEALTTMIKQVTVPVMVVINCYSGLDTYECDWYNEITEAEKLAHALHLGRIYYWWENRLTAVHFQPTDDPETRRCMHCPTPLGNLLAVSNPHECYYSDLKNGQKWQTLSFGETVWWEKRQRVSADWGNSEWGNSEADARQKAREWWENIRSEYSSSSHQTHYTPPHDTPRTENEWIEYLKRIREEFLRDAYQQTHASPPPPRSVNRWNQSLAVLGLEAGATPEQIKQAYRQKALETHPDTGGSHEAFILVQQAYNYLKG